MKRRKDLLLLMAVSLVVCMIFGGCGGVQSSPAKVVEAYFEAFQQKDMKTAFGYTLNDEGLSDSDLADLEGVLKDFEIKDYKVEKVEKLNNTQSVVSVEVTTVFQGDESKAVSEVNVIKKDGKWFIDDGGDSDDWDEDRSEPEGNKGDADPHEHEHGEGQDDAAEGTDDGEESVTDDQAGEMNKPLK